MKSRNKSLVEMKEGEEGIVADIQGGIGLYRRLDAMHITRGVHLRKIGGSFMRGPVTVQIGNARVALGFGMAARIILEVGEKATQ